MLFQRKVFQMWEDGSKLICISEIESPSIWIKNARLPSGIAPLLIALACKTMRFHLRHMERTLERLLQIQAAMEELAVALDQAEGVRDAWEPVGDLFIDSLQDHIDATKVRHRGTCHIRSRTQITDLNPYKSFSSHWSRLTVAKVPLGDIFSLCRLYNRPIKRIYRARFAGKYIWVSWAQNLPRVEMKAVKVCNQGESQGGH